MADRFGLRFALHPDTTEQDARETADTFADAYGAAVESVRREIGGERQWVILLSSDRPLGVKGLG